MRRALGFPRTAALLHRAPTALASSAFSASSPSSASLGHGALFASIRSCATPAAAAAAADAASAKKRKPTQDPEALIDSILSSTDDAATGATHDDESLFWLTDAVEGGGDNNNNAARSPEFLRVLAAANQLIESTSRFSTSGPSSFSSSSQGKPASPSAAMQPASVAAAARVFASIAPYMQTAPVLILARLLAVQWPEKACTEEMRKRMRREVFARCGDLRTGEEVAKLLVAWSLNGAHAADVGMFRKLGKLLEYHIGSVENVLLLLQAMRALRRARIQPPPEFVDVVARRLVVLQRNAELKLKILRGARDKEMEAVRKQQAELEKRAVTPDENAVPVPLPPVLVAEKRKDSSSVVALHAAGVPHIISSREAIQALRLFAGFGPATMPRFLVVQLVRIIAASLESRLVRRGAIDPALLRPDDLLDSYPNTGSKIGTTAASSSSSSSPQNNNAFGFKQAVAVLTAARFSPIHLAYVLSTLSAYRITTTKYTRPFGVLMAALAPKLPSSVLFGLFVPSLVRFPAGTACTDALVKQIVKRATQSHWEDLVYSARLVVSQLEHASDTDIGALAPDAADVAAEITGAAASDSAAAAKKAATPEDDVRRFFTIVNDKFSHFARAPTTWQMVLLARYAQRALKADRAGLEDLVLQKLLPTIATRFAVLLDLGVAPLKHYDHLEETLTLAGLSPEGGTHGMQCAAFTKLRDVRRDVSNATTPYRKRLSTSAVFLPLYQMNESIEFNRSGVLDPEQRRALREFSAARLVPQHPTVLLKTLQTFDQAFPKVLQPALRREFSIVLENRLRVPIPPASERTISSASGKHAPSAAGSSRLTVVPMGTSRWEHRPISFESKEALREFVDLLWKAAPKECKTAVTVWEFVAHHAKKVGDEVLMRKAQQIVKTVQKLHL